ncbi:MAG: hypothetical protein DRN26_05910, partial [Thermoplasmata archaeon]
MKSILSMLLIVLVVMSTIMVPHGSSSPESAFMSASVKMYIINNKGDVFTEIPKEALSDPYLEKNWYVRLIWENGTPVDDAIIFFDVLDENGTSLYENLIPSYKTINGFFPLPPEIRDPRARYLVVKKVLYNSLMTKPYPSEFYLPDVDNESPQIIFLTPTPGSISRPGEKMNITVYIDENFLIEAVSIYVKQGQYGSEIELSTSKIGPNKYRATYVPTSIGELYIRVVAYDYYGNKGEETLKILVTNKEDSYPVTIHSYYPPSGRYNNPRPTIIFNYSEDLGLKVMDVRINGVPIENLTEWKMYVKDYHSLIINGTQVYVYSIALQPISDLADGTYEFYVYLEDYGGNVAEKRWYYIVDTTGPSVTYQMLNGVFLPWYEYTTYVVNTTLALKLSSPSEDCIGFEYRVDRGAWAFIDSPTGSAEVDIDLSQYGVGNHLIEFRGVDDLGNKGSIENVTVIYDPTPPKIDVPFTFNRTKDVSISFTVTLTDNVALKSYEVYKNGEIKAAKTFTEMTTSAKIIVEDNLFNEGDYKYKIVATDMAGNVNVITVTIQVDRTGPTVTILSPKNGDIFGAKDLPIRLIVHSDDSDILYFEYSLDGG